MKIYITLFSIIVLFSCTVLPKGGVSYFGEEKNFSKQLKSYTTYKREAQGREPGWELGFAFIPHKDGRISGIWLKNPTNGNIPVSIWDADTKQIIQTLQFNNSDTLNYNHFVLTQPITLIAQKKYCITVNVTKYYYHSLPFTSLPIQANNCTMVSSVYEETYYQRFPQYEINNVIHGLIDVDLDFKQ
ncbi:MAG: DUF4082 domain-containing protein [Chitinophagaceae bacterium]|nr:DUF4082 domain-containing protein [Chitinophagaceae bacterium]